MLTLPVLKAPLQCREELISALTIDDTMVDCQSYVATRAYRDDIVAIFERDHGTLFDFADAEDRRLRLMNDNRRGQLS